MLTCIKMPMSLTKDLVDSSRPRLTRVGRIWGSRKVFFKLREVHSNKHYNQVEQAILQWRSSNPKTKRTVWEPQLRAPKQNLSRLRIPKSGKVFRRCTRPRLALTYTRSKRLKCLKSRVLNDQALRRMSRLSTHLTGWTPLCSTVSNPVSARVRGGLAC